MDNNRTSEQAPGPDNRNGVVQVPRPFRFSMLSRAEKAIIVAVSVANLLDNLLISVLAPFFLKEADQKNVDETISGWIFGVMPLVKCVTSPIVGKHIHKVGSRNMLCLGILTSGVLTICFGFLNRVDVSNGNLTFIVLCFATRILQALGSTAIMTSFFVVFVQSFPDHISTVFGFVEISTGVGLVIGPALGGFLYDVGGFFLPFAVAGISCILVLPLMWLALPSRLETQASETNGLSSWTLLIQPKSIVNSIVVIILAANSSVLDPTLEPHLRVYGQSSTVVGLLFVIFAAVYSVTSPVIGLVERKTPDSRVLLILGSLIGAVAFVLPGPSPVLGFTMENRAVWLTAVSLALLGLSVAMCTIPTYNIYMRVLSEFGGSSLGGFLYTTIGFEWLTTAFAAVCTVTSFAVTLSWAVEWKLQKGKPREPLKPQD